MPEAGQIAIAGAGIAGLTCALAMARAGYKVTIYERAPQLQEVGAGLQLSPNATRILRELGVIDRILPHAVRPNEIAIRRADSLRLLSSVELGQFALDRWGAPYLTIHRADLQKALLEAALDNPSITLVTGARVERVSTTKGNCSLTIAGTDHHFEATSDLVVGADGVWSTVRSLFGKGIGSFYTGYIAWRTTVGDGGKLVPIDRVTTFVHRNFHLVAYPIRAGKEINLVAVTPGLAEAMSWSNDSTSARLEVAMAGADPALLALVRRAQRWTTWPIHEVPPATPWTFAGKVALIGDAAHAVSPYAAQGAAMAIEDAQALADQLKVHPDIASALTAYEAQRKPRLRRVASRGRFNRFAWHASGPIALGRDIVLSRRTPQQLATGFDWLYGYTQH